ncbi:hypothetical protein ASD65_17990 [Microbacterium sp. Root61]|uniref:hypothetical protein n=1 Tax=Microbacterium sp. Root61 TaxID=1736570 RepID=UPI0007017A14|nr:hypothetical protein [Microbacterium sp. Root61]KRA22369.1 hypothetical protein ASD65_17990 [Microbacterium sp. Root61]
MSPRQLRTLRGVAAAGIATVLAATAHTLGGGGAPAPAFLAAIAVLASPGAVLLVGRRLSRLRVIGIVAGSQALFHTAFALVGTATPSGASSSPHAHGIELSALLAAPASAAAGTEIVPDAAMLLTHVLAAAVTAAVIYRGERMLRALVRGIGRVLSRALVPVVAVRTLLRTAIPWSVPTASLSARRSGVSRRGPPVALVF